MYSEEDYNCPNCGWIMDYSTVEKDGWEYICPECCTHFETPDI